MFATTGVGHGRAVEKSPDLIDPCVQDPRRSPVRVVRCHGAHATVDVLLPHIKMLLGCSDESADVVAALNSALVGGWLLVSVLASVVTLAGTEVAP